MKLVTNTQMTLDGVVQGTGSRNENRSGGFKRGGWAWALTDSEGRKFVEEFYQRADAFLFGRRTYDLFAGSWGVMESGSSPTGYLHLRRRVYSEDALVDQLSVRNLPTD